MRKRLKAFVKSIALALTKPIKKLVEFFRRKPRVAQAAAAVVTPGICLIVTAVLSGWWPSTLMMVQIMVHEYAHYIVARIVHVQEVWLPFFIPLIIGATGKTYVDDPDPEKHRKIALAGPIAGLILAVIFLIAGFAFGQPLLIAAGVVFTIAELFSALFGADGVRYREANRERRTRSKEVINV